MSSHGFRRALVLHLALCSGCIVTPVGVENGPSMEAASDASVMNGADVGSMSPPSPTPQWLVGSYSNGSDISNNTAQVAGDREIVFELGPMGATYRWKTGRTFYNTTGAWRVESNVIVLDGGPLGGARINVTPNCRILVVNGDTVWRGSRVSGCPWMPPPPTAEECTLVGQWRWSTQSGSPGGSVMSSEGRSLNLDEDRFALYSTSRSTSRCVSNRCSTQAYYPRPTPGTWSLAAGVLMGVPVSIEELRTWRVSNDEADLDAGVPTQGICPQNPVRPTPPIGDGGAGTSDAIVPRIDSGAAPTDVPVSSDRGGPDPCVDASSCNACTARPTCGWCNGRCWNGNAVGPVGGSCGGNPWAWTSNMCASTSPDGGASTCEPCVIRSCPTQLAACGRDPVCARCASEGGAGCTSNASYSSLLQCACGSCRGACSAVCGSA